MKKLKRMAMGLGLAAALAGCANFTTTTFRAEKAAGDTARGAVHAWNQYYPLAVATADATEKTKLDAEQAQVYAASRKLGATLAVVEGSRLAYLTNAANTNLTTLQAALEAATSQSAGIFSLVSTFMGSTPPTPTVTTPTTTK